MAGLIPPAVKQVFVPEGESLVVTVAPGHANVSIKSGGRNQEIGFLALSENGEVPLNEETRSLLDRFADTATPAQIVIDDANVIRRQFTLPKAAATEVAGALSFEIERQTPFRAEEIYLSFDAKEDLENGLLLIQAAIVPRKIVDPIVIALKGVGLTPHMVTLSPAKDKDGNYRSGRQLPVPNLPPASSRRTNHVRLSILVAGLLISVLVAVLFYKLDSIEGGLDKALAEARKTAAPSLALKNSNDQLTRANAQVIQLKSRTPSSLNILTELTKILPDDVWIVQVDIRGRDVAIEGRSNSSSAKLIALLEESPLFDTAKYQAPVTRDATQNYERFNIELTLSGEGYAKAALK